MNTLHRIKVLGRDLQVRSTADSETVRNVELFVNEKLAEVADSVKMGDTQVVAILALMNIAEEYLTLVKATEASSMSSRDRIQRLIGRIDADIE